MPFIALQTEFWQCTSLYFFSPYIQGFMKTKYALVAYCSTG